MCVFVCVCVCVEVCVCVCVSMCENYVCVCVCVCERERELSVCACVKCVCVHACVCMCMHVCVCVCVCVHLCQTDRHCHSLSGGCWVHHHDCGQGTCTSRTQCPEYGRSHWKAADVQTPATSSLIISKQSDSKVCMAAEKSPEPKY